MSYIHSLNACTTLHASNQSFPARFSSVNLSTIASSTNVYVSSFVFAHPRINQQWAGLQSLGLEPPALQLFVSGTVAALGLFLAYLRVRLGFHTADQVVVGVGVGIGSALGWFYLGMQYAFPYFFVNEGAVVYLWATTAVAVVAFAGRTVIGWVQEKQLRKRLAAEKKEE